MGNGQAPGLPGRGSRPVLAGRVPSVRSSHPSISRAFVAIGRRPNTGPSTSLWGPAAVVCDPWVGRAYLAQETYLKMGWYCFQWRSRLREE